MDEGGDDPRGGVVVTGTDFWLADPELFDCDVCDGVDPLSGVEVLGTLLGIVAGVELGWDAGTVLIAGSVDEVCVPDFGVVEF